MRKPVGRTRVLPWRRTGGELKGERGTNGWSSATHRSGAIPSAAHDVPSSSRLTEPRPSWSPRNSRRARDSQSGPGLARAPRARLAPRHAARANVPVDRHSRCPTAPPLGGSSPVIVGAKKNDSSSAATRGTGVASIGRFSAARSEGDASLRGGGRQASGSGARPGLGRLTMGGDPEDRAGVAELGRDE